MRTQFRRMKHRQQTRNTARDLWVDGKTIQAIAASLGVNKSTLSRWRQADNWDQARQIQATTPGELKREFQNSIYRVLQDAKGADRTLTASEVDMITKLRSNLEKLDPRANYISVAMDVFQGFQTFLVKAGVGVLSLEEFTNQVDAYMRELYHRMESGRLG